MTNIAENRRATFEYDLDQRIEAGLELKGWEVKALRAGRAQLTSGYVLVRRGEAWLPGLNITPLPQAVAWADDADRTRKLLLHRQQIQRIAEWCAQVGNSCVPIRLYWKGQLVKVEIALAKGRKLYDKRRAIKDRDYLRRKARLRRGQARSLED